MRKPLLLLYIGILCGLQLHAQTQYGETHRSRIYTGGNFGLGFGTFTQIDLSPLVGYNFTPVLSAGLGTTWMYYSYRYGNVSERASFYGGRVFTRLVPLPEIMPAIFLHAEFETINNERWIENDLGMFELKRTWTPAVHIGPGFRQQAGENSYFTFTVLWNLLDDGTSQSTIYGGPLNYRVGFIFGLR